MNRMYRNTWIATAGQSMLALRLALPCATTTAQAPPLFSPSPAPGQSSPASPPGSAPLAGLGADDTSGASSSSSSVGTSSVGSSAVLSAGQIFAILQSRPEVVVELKSYLADSMQQQGTSIQADAITDEVLFNQIASSPQVRAGITTFLRSRGFVSDEDLQRAALTSADATAQVGATQMQAPLFAGPLGTQVQSSPQENATETTLMSSDASPPMSS